MSFGFEEPSETTQIRQAVRRFAENEIAPEARKLDEAERFSPELTIMMGDQGFFGTLVGEKYGGNPINYLSYIVLVEELARVDSSQAATIAAHNSLGAAPIFDYGTEEQMAKYLPGLCTGYHLHALALSENCAGSDLQGIKTQAKKVDGGWIVNGSKTFITNSSSSLTSGITTFARTGEKDGKKQFTCFLVPTPNSNLITEVMHDKTGWRASNTGILTYQDVFVPDENVLGVVHCGLKMVLEILSRGRLSIGAIGLGLAKGAFEMTLQYVKDRAMFGQRLCDFQDARFILSRMKEKIEASELKLYKACWLCDNRLPFATVAADAKLTCAETAAYCAIEGQKLHGGNGIMKDYPIERFERDQKVLQVGEGAGPIMREIIARSIIGC